MRDIESGKRRRHMSAIVSWVEGNILKRIRDLRNWRAERGHEIHLDDR